MFLLSPARAVLQLRVPGQNVLVLLDAHEGKAARVEVRPASPEPALPAQATLRRQVEGGRVLAIVRERFAGAEQAKKAALRLVLETSEGPRALVAEPRAQMIFVLGVDAQVPSRERVLWAPPGAPLERRSGTVWPACVREGHSATAREPERAAAEEERDPGAADARIPEAGAGGAKLPEALIAAESSSLEASAQAQLVLARGQLVRQLESRKKKLVRTREAVLADRARAQTSAQERQAAELLLPMQSKIPRGAKEARVPDWSQLDDEGKPAELVLKLDPAISAAENASRWLKRAQRYQAALPRIDARVREIEQSIDVCSRLLEEAAQVEGALSLRTLTAEVARALPKERTQARVARRDEPERRLPYRAFRATNGARIFVGRSAKDNDALVRSAKGNDLWLHARGVQGSHVIVPDPGEAPDARLLGEAAMLAAHFSSAREADGADVAWTRRKYVRKSKGAAPGAVTFTQDKTLRVRADEAALQRLLATESA
ncbi:MAG: DUF814 domain-containing protein [Deltaproteobacteria bacterium]|nr:DUF814 domain-containing protein [Deltaproteobacteria bacterium]